MVVLALLNGGGGDIDCFSFSENGSLNHVQGRTFSGAALLVFIVFRSGIDMEFGVAY